MNSCEIVQKTHNKEINRKCQLLTRSIVAGQIGVDGPKKHQIRDHTAKATRSLEGRVTVRKTNELMGLRILL